MDGSGSTDSSPGSVWDLLCDLGQFWSLGNLNLLICKWKSVVGRIKSDAGVKLNSQAVYKGKILLVR